MYIDDIKPFAKKRKRIGNSNARNENIQAGHRDGIWHRKMRHAKDEKWQATHDGEGVELPNQVIRTLEETETYKYLGILEADTIKQVEMKEKIKKVYLWRTRKLLETKLYSRKLIEERNT